MIPNERPTPLTKLIMDNVSISIRADTREQSLAHKEEAEREIATLERSLAERTEERDKWANVAAQYSAEREHNANMALAYKAERDTALAKLAAVTAERDALKADLCTFAVDLEKQLSAVTAERDAAIRSWDEERQRAEREGKRVVELTEKEDALKKAIDLVDRMHRKASDERDALKAKLAKCRDETYRAQTEALVLQAQLAGYLLSIAASDPRNETIFTTIDKLLAALGIPPARQTLEETK